MPTITVRIIKSFEYRTIRNYVLHDLDLSMTLQQLLEKIQQEIKTNGAYRPYRNVELNAFKIYWYPQMTKTQNLAINLDKPEWLYTDLSKTLDDLKLVDESEISCFNLDMYKEYEKNPVNKWE